jgi:hypothetical protein
MLAARHLVKMLTIGVPLMQHRFQQLDGRILPIESVAEPIVGGLYRRSKEHSRVMQGVHHRNGNVLL